MPPVEHFLTVDVKSDREQYEPRQEGTVTITTRDADRQAGAGGGGAGGLGRSSHRHPAGSRGRPAAVLLRRQARPERACVVERGAALAAVRQAGREDATGAGQTSRRKDSAASRTTAGFDGVATGVVGGDRGCARMRCAAGGSAMASPPPPPAPAPGAPQLRRSMAANVAVAERARARGSTCRCAATSARPRSGSRTSSPTRTAPPR